MLKNLSLISLLFILTSINSFGQKQMKFGNNPFMILSTSILELESTNRGLQLPRLTTAQASGILSAAKVNNASGLIIYNTESKRVQVFDASTTLGQWIDLTGSVATNTSWSLVGNAGTSTTSNFIGTTDNTDFLIKTNNTERLRVKSTGETDFSNQIIQKFSAKIIEKTVTAYTIALDDNGSVLLFNNTSAINVTIPNTLPIGFNLTVYQMGTGNISFIPFAGTTILQRSNTFTTAGQYAAASLLFVSAGTALLSGDLN